MMLAQAAYVRGNANAIIALQEYPDLDDIFPQITIFTNPFIPAYALFQSLTQDEIARILPYWVPNLPYVQTSTPKKWIGDKGWTTSNLVWTPDNDQFNIDRKLTILKDPLVFPASARWRKKLRLKKVMFAAVLWYFCARREDESEEGSDVVTEEKRLEKALEELEEVDDFGVLKALEAGGGGVEVRKAWRANSDKKPSLRWEWNVFLVCNYGQCFEL
ncbi:hypothetical protein HDV00_012664 [Rhizophlyctis rosea]|nr:hypothetical protein HDV00_012664 [Rhizophlyctis rosea]